MNAQGVCNVVLELRSVVFDKRQRASEIVSSSHILLGGVRQPARNRRRERVRGSSAHRVPLPFCRFPYLHRPLLRAPGSERAFSTTQAIGPGNERRPPREGARRRQRRSVHRKKLVERAQLEIPRLAKPSFRLATNCGARGVAPRVALLHALPASVCPGLPAQADPSRIPIGPLRSVRLRLMSRRTVYQRGPTRPVVLARQYRRHYRSRSFERTFGQEGSIYATRVRVPIHRFRRSGRIPFFPQRGQRGMASISSVQLSRRLRIHRMQRTDAVQSVVFQQRWQWPAGSRTGWSSYERKRGRTHHAVPRRDR